MIVSVPIIIVVSSLIIIVHPHALFQGYHHMAVRFLSLAMSRNKFIVLKRRMDNSSLIGIHGLQCDRLPGSLYLKGNIFRQIFQGFFSSLPVVFRIHFYADIFITFLVCNQAGKILKRIQGLSSLSDENPHILSVQLHTDFPFFLVG